MYVCMYGMYFKNHATGPKRTRFSWVSSTPVNEIKNSKVIFEMKILKCDSYLLLINRLNHVITCYKKCKIKFLYLNWLGFALKQHKERGELVVMHVIWMLTDLICSNS